MASAVYLTFTIVVTKIECSLVAIVVFGTVNNRDLWLFAPNRHFNKATTTNFVYEHEPLVAV